MTTLKDEHPDAKEAGSAASSSVRFQRASTDVGLDDLDWRKAVFWGVGIGMGVRAIAYPFMVIKTRLQVQQSAGQDTATKGTQTTRYALSSNI